MDGLERVCLVAGRSVRRLVSAWGGSWTNVTPWGMERRGWTLGTRVVSGARQSVSSPSTKEPRSSGPVISYDLSVSPWPSLFSGRQGDWWLLGPYSFLQKPLPRKSYSGGFGPPGPHQGLA